MTQKTIEFFWRKGAKIYIYIYIYIDYILRVYLN